MKIGQREMVVKDVNEGGCCERRNHLRLLGSSRAFRAGPEGSANAWFSSQSVIPSNRSTNSASK
jgi:hypothetical protein